MRTEIAVIITSVIYHSERPLSYSDTRSAFSPEERAAQTVGTIASVREKLPGAWVVLVEAGRRRDLPRGLVELVDQYIYVGTSHLVRWACDSRYKGLGEAVMLLASAPHLIKASRYFKLSGRYALTGRFSLKSWPSRGIAYRAYGKGMSTRLYMFDGGYFFRWLFALIACLPGLYRNRSIEDLLPKFILKRKAHAMPYLGVTGLVGPDGVSLDE